MGPDNSANAYEEVRKQRLEENKKRMQELNLVALSNSISETRNSANKSTPQRNAKARTPKLERGSPVSVRRSSRVANIPPPDYREAPIDIPYLRKNYGRRPLFTVRCANFKERQEAIETASMIEAELGSAHPIFLKPMLHSHVSGGFWLGLPTHFCSMNMPKHDEWMILEDENGEDTRTLFLAGKTGLSAGWRGFSIDHHLEDGDCLVFQLVQKTRFKVYIVRAAGFESADNSEQPNNTENLQNEADNPAEKQPNNTEDLQCEADKPDRDLQEHDASVLGKRKRPLKAGKKPTKNTVQTEDGKLSKKSGNVKTTVDEKERDSDAKDGKKVLKKSGKINDENESHKSKTKGQSNKLQTRKTPRLQNHIKTSEAPSPMVMVQDPLDEKERASDAKNGTKVLKKSGKVNDENESHKSKTKGQSNKMSKKTDAGANAESGSNKKLTKMLQTRKTTRFQNHIKTSEAPSPMVTVQA